MLNHDIGDKVWVMQDNKPVEKVVYRIVQEMNFDDGGKRTTYELIKHEGEFDSFTEMAGPVDALSGAAPIMSDSAYGGLAGSTKRRQAHYSVKTFSSRTFHQVEEMYHTKAGLIESLYDA